MVLDFLKRKKRWEGVHSLTLPRLSSSSLVVPPEVPGLYTSRGEWGEEQGGRGEGNTQAHISGGGGEVGGRLGVLPSPPDVTWDTLKRIRRASTAARRPRTFGSCQWEGGLGKGSERHQSSPNLSLAAKPACSNLGLAKPSPDLSTGLWPNPPQEFSSLPQAQSVLRFTRWERHNSLITLDIAGSQSSVPPSLPQQWIGDGGGGMVRREEEEQKGGEAREEREEGLGVCREVEGEGDGGEEDEENDDSGLFYDSDSGISSLYEAIGGGGVKGQGQGEESTGVARLRSLLSGWGVDRHLQHLFITATPSETSFPGSQSDAGETCEILPFANLVPSDVSDPNELVVVIGEILGQKQELLSLKLLELQLQLTDGEEFVSYLESVLIARGGEEQNGNNVRQIRPLLRRLDSAWSLVASIRRRIACLEERMRLQQQEEEEDFSLRHSLLLLREQLAEAETLCEACVRVRKRCEAAVEKIAPEQFSRLRDLFDSRLKVLQVQGNLKAELHRTRLQAKLLAYAK